MSFVKNYNPGTIRMDLPTSNYIYELPLLSFADIHGTVNLSLIFNYRMKEEQGNPFRIAPGYKLNLQKQLIMGPSGPTALQEEDGKCTDLISTGGVYVLDNDDQRILRRDGTNYVMENMDFSKEIYDQTGKIISTYDKYNNLILSYAYEPTGQLLYINYRNSKSISFGNVNNVLEYIYYAESMTFFTFSTNQVVVEHYSGVKYTLTTSSDPCDSCGSSCMDFLAVANNPSNTSIAPRSVALTRIASHIRIAYKNDGETIDAATYAFLGSPDSSTGNYQLIEIANDTGVATRLQYGGRDLCCSYDISDGDVTFVGNENNESAKHSGSVQIYKAMNEGKSPHVSGTLGVNNSAFTFAISDARRETYIPMDIATADNGYYVLTGWIRSSEDAENSNDNTLIISNGDSDQSITLHPTLAPDNKWTFFAYKFYLPGTRISIYGSPINIELNDVRMTFYSSQFPEGQYASSLDVTEDVLIAHNGTADVILPLAECYFYCGTPQIASKGATSFDDLLKYKIRRKLNADKSVQTTEFSYNHCKQILALATNAEITVACASGSYDLSNCYLGRRRYTSNGITTERIVDNNGTYFLIYQAMRSDGSVYFAQVINNHLDVTTDAVDNISYNHTHDQDLIVLESVPDLYDRYRNYSTDSQGNPVITETDEFGKVTQYTLDKDWGCVTKVLLPDGSTITDTYDDDMCSLLTRKFASTPNRCTEFAYSKGNLSDIRHGRIDYSFTYNNRGKLTGVTKMGAPVESHTYNDDNTCIQSYYPSQNNALHSVTATFNTYGKLVSIAGALINTYDIWPEFDPDTGELKAQRRGRNALLAKSMDTIQGETSRYTYDPNSGLLAMKEVTDKNNYASKVSTETFGYDKLGRITNDHFNYLASNSVTSQIAYKTAVTDPNADNRVRTYTYSTNDTTAVTTTYYDRYKRPEIKYFTINGKIFSQRASYQNTRLNFVSDSFSNGIHLDYDDCGRIQFMRTDGSVAKYYYDQYGQLVREDNQALAKSYVYVYDIHGCLTAVKAYNYTTGTLSGTPVTTTFGYSDDQLTSFGGATIAYNAIGCPTTYDGMSATWAQGKLSRLTSGTPASGTEIHSFGYNALGQRVAKTYSFTEGTTPSYAGKLIGSTKKFYYDHSGRLIAEHTTKEYYDTDAENESIIFLYDGNTVIGMQHTVGGVTSSYYFHRNPLGDVIGILNTNGVMVAKYIYDAWGNCTISGDTTNIAVAQANPIRYRGYYYDSETGLYYCNARYYSPKWRRFISPDDTAYLDPSSVNGLNQYCYCGNDPVNLVDPSGHIPLLAVLAIAGAALGFGLATYADYQADGVYFNGNIGNYLSYTLEGAFIGGVLGAGIGAFFAGSFFASMSAVKTGVLLTGGLIRAGGFGAAGMMMYDNFRNALHYSTHIFWSGSELSKNAAEYLAGNTGGITLEMTKLGQYLSNLPDLSREVWSIASANFANQVHNGSTIFVVHNSMGVGINSIWAKIEFPILIKKIIDMIYVLI